MYSIILRKDTKAVFYIINAENVNDAKVIIKEQLLKSKRYAGYKASTEDLKEINFNIIPDIFYAGDSKIPEKKNLTHKIVEEPKGE